MVGHRDRRRVVGQRADVGQHVFAGGWVYDELRHGRYLRAELIAMHKAVEETVPVDRLLAAREIYVGNSLRGLIPAKFAPRD